MNNIVSSADVRRSFLEYFRERGHTIVASSSLVPANDPTLLFVNAGMVQFKDLFLGNETREYVRATTSQRCVRAGGKHNDLENVGYTARHHTFFEMLGNFSFGDYFKREGIKYAWDYLTNVLGLPAEKLWVTVYEEDQEAEDIWLKEMGADPTRFSRIGAKDNFWQMGDTGPCGPCSEIFYDHGPEVPGGPPGTPEEDGDRYIEIWNLVFMQFDRAKDGTLTPLPKPSVDTGMGLERIAAVMQHVHSNYEIDLFQNLIKSASEIIGCEDLNANSLKVVADHIRSAAFMIVDGVLPSKDGRGYVLRRIIRRAIRHGFQLGAKEGFMHKLVPALVAEMGEAFPELAKAQADVVKAIAREEEQFSETLEKGMRVLEADLAVLKGTVIPGDTVFQLYDTFGFPVDLTADIARERNLTLDMDGFEQAMNQQRERARSKSNFAGDQAKQLPIEGVTDFSGYEHLEDQSTVGALFRDGEPVEILEQGVHGVVVLDRSVFYAESGGQVGDAGLLVSNGIEFRVEDTRKQGAGTHLHFGVVGEGALRVGDKVAGKVDAERRQATALNHSATHLLHAALREVLGTHVVQKGSLVDPDRLRFDFSNPEPVKADQLAQIERMVNDEIRGNVEVETHITDMEQAVAAGALALFGEKYGDEVRVLRMGDFSTELCGGTHVKRLGDIGLLKIVSEGGVASGIRRIEAVTGSAALDYISATESTLSAVASLVKGQRDSVLDKVGQNAERMRQLEKELDQLKSKLASSQGSDLASQAVEVGGIKVLAAKLDGADVKTLRETVDQLRDKLGAAAIVLASVEGESVKLIAGVSKAETGRIKAGDLVNCVATQVGGKGGGRPDMAQAGGNNPGALDAALDAVPDWVRSQLA